MGILLESPDVRRVCWNSWNWSYWDSCESPRGCWDSARTSALNHWAIPPPPLQSVFNLKIKLVFFKLSRVTMPLSPNSSPTSPLTNGRKSV